MTLFLYLLSLLALSTSPIFAKYSQIPIESLGFYRLTLATFLLLTYRFVYASKRGEIQVSILKARWSYIFSLAFFKTKDFYWLLAAGFCFFLHLFFYFYAAHNTTIANTTVVYASNPLFSAFLAAFLFKEKLSWRFFLSYLIAFIGLMLLFQRHSLFEIQNLDDFFFLEFKKGEFAALLAAFFFALYINFSKKARRTYDNQVYATVKYGLAASLFLFWGLTQNHIIWPLPTTGWISVIGQVSLATFLGHFLFSYLLKSMDIQLMTCGKLIEPAFSAFFAFLIFNEVLSPNTWLAFLFMSVALLVLFSNSIYKFIFRNRV